MLELQWIVNLYPDILILIAHGYQFSIYLYCDMLTVQLIKYGTAQRQLDSRGYFTLVSLSCCTRPGLRVHAYMHTKV